MCGRFYIDPEDMTDEELIRLLNREKERSDADSRLVTGEVRPGDAAAVIARNRKGQRSAFVMQWGYRGNRGLLINARSETAAEKPTFREGLRLRRCLIPASAYFEWDHRTKPLQKYRFEAPSSQKVYLAGLYRFEAENPLPVFTILTREATPGLSCFHDRMPVIISAQNMESWLDHRQNPQLLMQQSITELRWSKAE